MPRTSKPPRTVLVADDSHLLRDLLRELLESMNMTVLEAASAADSVSIAAAHPQKIDLLLTDIEMPGSSGWESALTIARLRPEIRVVYMSGGVSWLDWNASKVGPTGSYFLEKPFRPEALHAVLKDLFPASLDSQGALAKIDDHKSH